LCCPPQSRLAFLPSVAFTRRRTIVTPAFPGRSLFPGRLRWVQGQPHAYLLLELSTSLYSPHFESFSLLPALLSTYFRHRRPCAILYKHLTTITSFSTPADRSRLGTTRLLLSEVRLPPLDEMDHLNFQQQPKQERATAILISLSVGPSHENDVSCPSY
jgi:hypothetical protein